MQTFYAPADARSVVPLQLDEEQLSEYLHAVFVTAAVEGRAGTFNVGSPEEYQKKLLEQQEEDAHPQELDPVTEADPNVKRILQYLGIYPISPQERTPSLVDLIHRAFPAARKLCDTFLHASQSVDLSHVVPMGSLVLADVGHNGYTWYGKRAENYTIASSLLPEQPTELLVSYPIIGSGSGVYVPLLPVGHAYKKGKNPETPQSMLLQRELPLLLMYDPKSKGYAEAEFNPKLGNFTPCLDSPLFVGSHLELTALPEVYKENLNLDISSDVYRSDVSVIRLQLVRLFNNVHNRLRYGNTFTYSLLSFFDNIIGYDADTHSSSSSNFTDTLVYELSPKVDSRWKFFRQFLTLPYDDEKLLSYCNVLSGEISDVIAKGKDLSPDMLVNRFLLTRGFEHKNLYTDTSFLVGKINGDSQTMHFPYAPVKLKDSLTQ